MSQPTPVRAAPEATKTQSRPDGGMPRTTSRERTAPAITREAPWFAFNASSVPVQSEGPAFGPTRFVLGANVPWVHEGVDIGTSPLRPEGGLHAHPEDAALLRQVFERLRSDGVETARFFVLADGRAGLRFSEDGTPEGLDGAVFPDLEVVLEAARSSGIGLILVLLDERWMAPPSAFEGRQVGGHSDTIRDPAKRTALLERVLRPLLLRCADHPAILAWEILANADLQTVGHGPAPVARRPVRDALRRLTGSTRKDAEASARVTVEEMRAFLCDAVALVHRHTRALATVGVGRWSELSLVRGLGLDVYSVGWPADETELRTAVSDLRLDRPLFLNSFPGGHPRKSIKTILDTARCAGFGGAFVWSVLRHGAASGYDGQVGQWSRNHAAHLHRRQPAPAAPASEQREEVAAAVSATLVVQR